jgi:hypothetical protein
LLSWIAREQAARAPTFGFASNFVVVEILRADYPWRALAELLRRQRAIAEHAPYPGGTDGQSDGCLLDRHLTSVGTFTFSVGSNPLMPTQRTDSIARPAIATAGRLARTVQGRSDRFVWQLTSKV